MYPASIQKHIGKNTLLKISMQILLP